jgi:hypothetical protein
MKIMYQPAFENQLGFGITIFLGLCSSFAVAVALLNFGRYGYVPSFSFFWPAFALVLHLNIKVSLDELRIIDLKRGDHSWKYSVSLFRIELVTKVFSRLKLMHNGKFTNVGGFQDGDLVKTWIEGDQDFIDSSLSFISHK